MKVEVLIATSVEKYWELNKLSNDIVWLILKKNITIAIYAVLDSKHPRIFIGIYCVNYCSIKINF